MQFACQIKLYVYSNFYFTSELGRKMTSNKESVEGKLQGKFNKNIFFNDKYSVTKSESLFIEFIATFIEPYNFAQNIHTYLLHP